MKSILEKPGIWFDGSLFLGTSELIAIARQTCKGRSQEILTAPPPPPTPLQPWLSSLSDPPGLVTMSLNHLVPWLMSAVLNPGLRVPSHFPRPFAFPPSLQWRQLTDGARTGSSR